MIFKRWKGQKITAKHPKFKEARWWMYKRIQGRVIYRSLPEAHTKEQAETAARRILDGIFNKKHGISADVPLVDFANGAYTRYCEQKNVNIGAKKLYIRIICERFKKHSLDDVTAQDCRDFQSRLTKKHSNSSVNRIMSTLSKMFTLACQEGILDRNPMQYVTKLEEPPPRNRLLTAKERERLWTELEKDTLLLRLVTVAVNLPLRRGQILAITPDAIDFASGLLYVTASKGRAPRVVPLNNTAGGTFQAMIREGQLPFPLKDFRKRWNRVTREAGINKKNGKRGENFTFHDLRHEMATELARRGAHTKTILDLYAHSDMKITQVYINPQFEDMRKAVNMLDEVQTTETVQ